MARSQKRTQARKRTRKPEGPVRRTTTRARRIAAVEVQELDAMRAEIARLGRSRTPARWNADPEDVRRSVAKLVLTLAEFIRQLLERQAIRRMDAGTLTAEQTEAVGLALMRLEEAVRDIALQFGLSPDELNLELGPAGRLI